MCFWQSLKLVFFPHRHCCGISSSHGQPWGRGKPTSALCTIDTIISRNCYLFLCINQVKKNRMAKNQRNVFRVACITACSVLGNPYCGLKQTTRLMVGVIWDASFPAECWGPAIYSFRTDLFWTFRKIYFIKIGNIAPSFMVTTSYFQSQKRLNFLRLEC